MADKKRDLTERLCRYCHAKFTGRNSKQYCNRACMAKGMYNLPDKTCPQCNKVFHARRLDQVYCNNICYNEVRCTVICKKCGKKTKAKRDFHCLDCYPIYKREKGWKTRLGKDFSNTEYQLLFSKQAGLCAICNKVGGDFGKSRLFLDHNHQTNKPRGLLCSRCNTAIGFFEDNLEYLSAARNYLITHV